MIRVERSTGGLTLVSRLARPRALVVLAVALLLGAAGLRGVAPRAALALAAAAALVVLVGGRGTRATFARDRVRVRAALPLQGGERALAGFASIRQETIGEARSRRAARLARGYADRSGSEAPSWLVPRPTAGVNDHLRRLVLVARDRDVEPFAVTAWLPPEDDLEPVRAEVEALLR